jgi:hypothetical protein
MPKPRVNQCGAFASVRAAQSLTISEFPRWRGSHALTQLMPKSTLSLPLGLTYYVIRIDTAGIQPLCAIAQHCDDRHADCDAKSDCPRPKHSRRSLHIGAP